MSPPPSWLVRFADRIAHQVHSLEIPSPLGCHYYWDAETEQWEITIFAAKTETVGGSRDGYSSCARYSLDLRGLVESFDEIDRFHWQALSVGSDDDLGSHISVEGRVNSQNIWLRVLAEPPSGFEAGRQLNVYDFTLEDVW